LGIPMVDGASKTTIASTPISGGTIVTTRAQENSSLDVPLSDASMVSTSDSSVLSLSSVSTVTDSIPTVYVASAPFTYGGNTVAGGSELDALFQMPNGGKKDEEAEKCWDQYLKDCPICTASRGGRACYARAAEKFANCLK